MSLPAAAADEVQLDLETTPPSDIDLDIDADLPAHNHLIKDNDESLWQISVQEERFYVMLRKLGDSTIYEIATTFRKWGRLMDWFKLREFVRKFLPKSIASKHLTGREAFDAFRAQRHRTGSKMLKREYRKQMWDAMRSSSIETRQKPSAKSDFSFIENLYEKVIVPFEKEYQFARIRDFEGRDSVMSPASGIVLLDDVDASNDEVFSAAPPASADIRTARTAVEQCLEQLRDDVLPQMQGAHQTDSVNARLKVLREQVGEVLQQVGTDSGGDWANIPTIPIVGQAGEGKSTLLNMVLAVTEVPAKLYNREGHDAAADWSDDSIPEAHHAAAVAAQLICRDQAAEGINCNNDGFLDIQRCCLGAAEDSEDRDRFGRRVMAAHHDRVIHELPSGPPALARAAAADAGQGPMFDREGRLNPKFKDVGAKGKIKTYGECLATVEAANRAFQKYRTDDVAVTGDFLLPNQPGGVSVTDFNTYIHGGDQYAAVIKYVSANFVLSRLSMLEKSEPTTSEEAKRMRAQILTVAFTIGQGLRPDDEEVKTYNNRRKQWIHDTGKRADWAVVVEGMLAKPHPTTSKLLGKIWIHEGAGRRGRVVDDRVYIRTRLDAVLDDSAKMLIEEVHIIAPSDVIDPEIGGVLVDTPGLGDPDVMRQYQTERAVNDATSIIVCSEKAISRGGAPTIAALCDLGVVSELAAEVVQRRRGQLITFAFNPEKAGRKAKAVPASEPDSVLHDDRLQEGEECANDIEDVLTNSLHKLAESGGHQINGIRPQAGAEFEYSYLQEEMAAPIVKGNISYIFPALYRGLELTGPEDLKAENRDVHEKYETKTGMPAFLQRLESMLRDGRVLTGDSVTPILEQFKMLLDEKPTFAKAPRVDVPQKMRDAAKRLLRTLTVSKKTSPDSKFLKDKSLEVITEQLKDSSKARNRGDPEQRWIRDVAGTLVTVFRDQVPECWSSLRRERRSEISVSGGSKMAQLIQTMDLCRQGCVFDVACAAAGHGGLSRDVWARCKAIREFDLERMWQRVVAGPLKATLDAVMAEVYAPKIAERLCNSGDPDGLPVDGVMGLLLEDGQHGSSVLTHSFRVELKINNLWQTCSREIGNWSRLKNFHKTDSLYRRVLNAVLQKIFEKAPAYNDMASLNANELADLLDTLFSKDALDAIQGDIENLLQEEVDKLFRFVSQKLGREVSQDSRSILVGAYRLLDETLLMHGDDDPSQMLDTNLEAQFDKTIQRLKETQKLLWKSERHERAESRNRRQAGHLQLSVPWNREEAERLTTFFKCEEAGAEETIDSKQIDDLLVKLCDRQSIQSPTKAEFDAAFPGHDLGSAVLPHNACIGELQLFSLLRQTLDDRCDLGQPDDPSSFATEMQQLLVDILRKGHHEGVIHGALTAFVEQYFAKIEIICSARVDGKPTIVVLSPESLDHENVISVTVRLLFNSDTGAMFLVRQDKKRPHDESTVVESVGAPMSTGALVETTRARKKGTFREMDDVGMKASVNTTSSRSAERAKRVAENADLESKSKRPRLGAPQRREAAAEAAASAPLAPLPLAPSGSGFRVRHSKSQKGRAYYWDPTTKRSFWCDEPHTWKSLARENEKGACEKARLAQVSPIPPSRETAASVLVEQLVSQSRARRTRSGK